MNVLPSVCCFLPLQNKEASTAEVAWVSAIPVPIRGSRTRILTSGVLHKVYITCYKGQKRKYETQEPTAKTTRDTATTYPATPKLFEVFHPQGNPSVRTKQPHASSHAPPQTIAEAVPPPTP